MFDRAIRLSSRRAETLTAVIQQCRDLYNTSLVKTYLNQFAEEKNVSVEALVRVADASERLRRPDEACELISRALKMEPDCAPALMIKGRLALQRKEFSAAEEALRAAIAKGDLITKPRALYELGAVLDRLERYDDAMAAFLQAKAILLHDAQPHIQQLHHIRAYLTQMRAQLSSGLFNRWFEAGIEFKQRYRLVFLCGHPRSGTTLLEQVLDSHADIVSAEETTNFNDYAYAPLQRRFPVGSPILEILDSAPTQILDSLRAAYMHASESSIGELLNGRILMDKNPSLTLSVPSLARFFPEAKILIALRDPRDVVLSCFMQPFVPVHGGSAAYLTLESAAEEYVLLMGIWRTVKPLLKNPTLEVKY
jgi:tetratricopeptide (TPR) repeat protein